MADESDIKFDDKLRYAIHYDWGKCYKRLLKNKSARKQFLDCLALKPGAQGPTEQLSKCYLEKAELHNALEYANECVQNYPKYKNGKLHRNECIYDDNEFEDCLVERYRMWNDNKRLIGGLDLIKLTELTIQQSIGHDIGDFLNDFHDAISELDKIKSKEVDDRPIWKVRREKGECDVVSICSKKSTNHEISDMHPRHLWQVQKKNRMYRCMFFSSPTTKIVEDLQNLLSDPRLDSNPYDESTKFIRNSIEDDLQVIKKFEFMLRRRQPIYAIKAAQCKRNLEKFNDMRLTRIQQATEFEAVKQLKNIKILKETDFSKLLTYVENVMTNFYLIKSSRLFPKKLQFLETIYNIIGNAYIEKMHVPEKNPGNIYILFEFAFGTKPHIITPKKFNNQAGFKKPIDHFSKRLKSTDIPIEKCYIYHELSRLYFEKEKYIESKEMGDELIKTSNSIPNYVYMVLGQLRVILVDDISNDLRSMKEHLTTVQSWQENLSGPILKFVEMTVSCVDAEIREQEDDEALLEVKKAQNSKDKKKK